ncbi:hypothetical protein LIER_11697 [Lithospermum erythrorhizon]|uniref:Transmembrane protein n=1 Tax=Lithospermum erythrorhizon TaxID=34254 RepID=A0AAV3PTB7_LITER
MDHNSQGDGDFVVDIESSRATNDEVGSPPTFLDGKLGNAEVSGGLVNYDGLVDCENRLNVISTEENEGEGSSDDLKVLINKELGVKAEDLVASRTRNDRRKSTGAKKPPKPPRPPRGYSLDAADQKFIKEIAELAMLKRSRIERMKALKKMKATKASSVSNSRGSIFAMFFSILFFLVIVFHGISCSSGSTSHFHGSPEPAGSLENFIMLKHRKRFPTNGIYSTTSESPNPLNKLTKASG